MSILTEDRFARFKSDYDVYGTHIESDKYRNDRIVKDEAPRGTIRVMWQPLTDAASIAEYGTDISRMYYADVYGDPGIQHGDVVTIRGEEYEVKGVKVYNQHSRVEVMRKKV